MTFSIVARSAGPDPETASWGVAVASKFLAVGSAVPAAVAQVGAIATQAHANVAYKGLALAHLDEGATDWARGRTALVATVRTTTAGPGAAPEVRRWRTRVVLQFDAAGHWLVTADTPITTDTPDVDD